MMGAFYCYAWKIHVPWWAALLAGAVYIMVLLGIIVGLVRFFNRKRE
jgi:hypothetical protein